MDNYGKHTTEGESNMWKECPEAELGGKKFAIKIRFATDRVRVYKTLQDIKDPKINGRDSKYYKRVNAISYRSKPIRKAKTGFNLGLKNRREKEEIAPPAD